MAASFGPDKVVLPILSDDPDDNTEGRVYLRDDGNLRIRGNQGWKNVNTLIPEWNTSSGTLWVDKASTLTFNGSSLTDTITVKFKNGTTTLGTTSPITPSASGDFTVSVPSSVYNNLPHNSSVNLYIVNEDLTESDPLSYNTASMDGTSSTRMAPSAKYLKDEGLQTSSGTYWINWNGTAYQMWCEQSLEGGGWMMVLNYNRTGGTNPELNFRTGSFPQMGSEYSFANEGGTSYWGHAATSLIGQESWTEMMWYAKTSFHSRVIHFTTNAPNAISYVKTGSGSMYSQLASSTYTTNGSLRNNATIPLYVVPSDLDGFADRGDRSMTDFPIYGDSNIGNPRSHWGIDGQASNDRWEVDDYPSSQGGSDTGHSTIHRIWVR
jgi:hypothetical protein